jgi:antitoxin HigA-1
MNRLALDLRVPVTRISEIVQERRGIATDTALRLAAISIAARYWLNLQTACDLEIAEDQFAAKIDQEVQPVERAERLAVD